jgi:capsid protein
MFDRIKRRIRSTYKRLKFAARVLFRGEYYDNISVDRRNDNHFANASDLPPYLTNTYQARMKFRVRARYEADNNCYLGGLIDTLATDVIGYVLPTLQVLTDNADLNTFIEGEWKSWNEYRGVNLLEKLKIMERCTRIDGESFPMMVTDDDALEKTGYGLNLVVIPQSRVTNQSWKVFNDVTIRESVRDGITYRQQLLNDDGIIIDLRTGNPVEFQVTPILNELQLNLIESNPVTVSARYMLQWYRPKWAGQFRGICEVGAALGLYAQLRRFDIATLTSAEIGAMLAGVMKTTNPPNDEPPEIKAGTELGLVAGSLIALPDGWDAAPFPANQPLSTYEMFTNVILRQIGRLLNVPFGIVAGDHSKYNYSSARLDVTGYDESKKYDRKQLQIRILNPIFSEWIIELAKSRPDVGRIWETVGIRYSWNFTNRPSIDPLKDAMVDDLRLKNGTDTYANIYSTRGMDYEEQFKQIQKERVKLSENNLTFDKNSASMANVGNTDNQPTDATQTA